MCCLRRCAKKSEILSEPKIILLFFVVVLVLILMMTRLWEVKKVNIHFLQNEWILKVNPPFDKLADLFAKSTLF